MEAVGPSAAVHEPPATARARTRHQAPIRAPPALRRAGRKGGGGGGGGGGQEGCRQINAPQGRKRQGRGRRGGLQVRFELWRLSLQGFGMSEQNSV